MQPLLATAGRVLYALPFGIFGVFHLMNAQAIAGLVPGVFPGPGTFWVYVTGVVFLLVAAALLAQKYTREAGLVLAFQLLVFILTVWVPNLSNPEMGQQAVVNLLKDTALLGAALSLAASATKNRGHSSDHQPHVAP